MNSMMSFSLGNIRKYPFFALFFFSLIVSTIILSLQFPFAFYSPDISFHSSKILLSSTGNHFTDSFSDTLSIYPSLFHVIFGELIGIFD